MKKNILIYISENKPWNDTEIATTTLANLLVKGDYNVNLLISKGIPFDKGNLDEKVKTYTLPESAIKITKTNSEFINKLLSHEQINSLIFFNTSYNDSELLFHIDTEKIKIIIYELTDPDAPLKLLKFRKKYILKNRRHSILRRIIFISKLSKLRQENKLLHQRLFDLADKYVLPSELYQKSIEKYIKKGDYHKFSYIPNPISIKENDVNQILEKEKLCICSSYLSREKGIFHLLKIWESIAQFHKDWTFIFIRTGKEEKKIKEYIKRNHISNILVDDTNSKIEEYYKKAAVICLTSATEGFPFALINAMHYGVVPISYSSFESIFEIISPKRDGLVVKPFNQKEFAKKLHQLMNDDYQLKVYSNNAKEGSKLFSKARILDMWKNILD